MSRKTKKKYAVIIYGSYTMGDCEIHRGRLLRLYPVRYSWSEQVFAICGECIDRRIIPALNRRYRIEDNRGAADN